MVLWVETEGNSETKKITPFLWFEKGAEEAPRFYVSIFKDAEIMGVTRPGIDRGGAGSGPFDRFPPRESGIHRLQRRPAGGFLVGHVLPGRMRGSGGSGLLLGETLGGRRAAAMRLAEGQIRGSLGRSSRPACRSSFRERRRQIQAGQGGDAEDDETRYRRHPPGVRETGAVIPRKALEGEPEGRRARLNSWRLLSIMGRSCAKIGMPPMNSPAAGVNS
jgi:hypothetical protein